MMDILQKFIFGEVFATGNLSLKQREMITCVTLAAMQALPISRTVPFFTALQRSMPSNENPQFSSMRQDAALSHRHPFPP